MVGKDVYVSRIFRNYQQLGKSFQFPIKYTKEVSKYRSSCPEVFCKKGVLSDLINSQENTCARVCCNIIKKETLTQVFSREFLSNF